MKTSKTYGLIRKYAYSVISRIGSKLKLIMLALRYQAGLNRGKRMKNPITVVPPLTTLTWRSPSVQVPDTSFMQAFFKPLSVFYDRKPKVHYYESVDTNYAIYYDWSKIGEDLRNAMLYYNIDGRRQLEGSARQQHRAGNRSAKTT